MEMQIVQGRQNATGYIGMLERYSLFTEGAPLFGEHWIYQEDNVAFHTARRSKDFSKDNNFRFSDHPPCSQDFNPIENLWGWMAGHIHKNGTQFQTVGALRQALVTSWPNIPDNLKQTLV